MCAVPGRPASCIDYRRREHTAGRGSRWRPRSKSETVSFDGKRLTVSARRGQTTITIPVRAIFEVEMSEYSWSTRPTLVPREARFELRVRYGNPELQWNGKTMVPMTSGATWYFPKSERHSVNELHRRLLAAI